jgi:hypothetical protein
MAASDSFTVARFSQGVAAAAAPRSTKAMLPIIVASSLERIAKIVLKGAHAITQVELDPLL